MILRPFVWFVLSCVLIFTKETNGSNTRGTPGVDYPNYSEIPTTTFRCDDQIQEKGFYPDFETRCQVFHYCGEDTHEAFICPIGTIFNELMQSCDHWFNSECRVPLSYEDGGVYQSRTDYGMDGSGVVQSSGSLYDKMASLYERSPSEAYEIDGGRMGYRNAEHSDYGSSIYGVSSQYDYDTRADNEELSSEISSGGVHSPLKHGGLENNGPLGYESIGEQHMDRNRPGMYGGIHAHTQNEAIIEDMNRATENDHSSGPTIDVNRGYHQSGEVSHSDPSNHPSQGMLYYRKPVVYHYDTNSKEHSDVFYGGEMNSQGAAVHVYAEYDDSEGDYSGDSGEGTVFQQRVSDYSRRPRPKPVVSYVESDLEIVTLPPQKAKRPRIPLVVENTEQSVTEPMTTTTENIIDVLRASESEELADGVSEDLDPSGDFSSNIEEKKNHTSTAFQSERKEEKDDFGDRVTEESSGDDESHHFEQPDSSNFQNSNPDDENNRNELEETDSSASQSVISDLYDKMSPNLFYVDPNIEYYSDESSSQDPITDEAFDEIYNRNHGINANEYGNGPYSSEEEDQFEKYHGDGELETEVGDTSEIQTNNRDFATEEKEYNIENEESEDNAEMFQEVVDQEGKTYIRFGDEIIDPAEYFPDWSEDDFQEANEADGKYSLDNSNPSEYQSQYSDSDSSESDQIMNTSPKPLEEKYFIDDLKDVSYGQEDEDSIHDSAETLAEMYHPKSDVYASKEGYDVLDTEGFYVDDGSGDAEDTLYSDFEYSNAPLYVDPVYFEGDVNSEEQEVMGGDKEMAVSEGIDTSSTPSDYYYTTDIGGQFVTDQPDMGVSSTAMLEEYSSNVENREFPFEMRQFDGSESDLEFQEFFQTDSNHFSEMDAASEQGTPTTEATIMEQALEFNDSDVNSESISGWSDNSKSSKIEVVSSKEQGTSTDEATIMEQALELNNSDVISESISGWSDNSNSSKMEIVSSKEQETPTTQATKMGQGMDSNILGGKSKSKSETLLTLLSLMDRQPTSEENETAHDSGKSSKNHTNFENDRKSHAKDSKFLKALGVRNREVDLSSDVSAFKKGSQSSSDEESHVRGDSKTKFQPSSSQKKPRSFSSSELKMTDENQRKKQMGRTGRHLPGSKLTKLFSFVKKLLAAKKKAKSNIIKRIIPSTEWDN